MVRPNGENEARRPDGGAYRNLQAWVRPGFAALERAAFRNPAIEWKQDSAPCCSAYGVPPLPKPALPGGTPPVLASPLAAARYQKIACRYVALTLVSHCAQS